MTRPVGIELDGKAYLLRPGSQSYRRIWHPAGSESRNAQGADRGTLEARRSDILEWRITDWSGGEGQRHINTRHDDTFARYFKSSAAVDIRRPGQIGLGLAASEDLDIGATTTIPHLVTAGKPWVVYDQTAKRKSGGTWSTITSGLTDNVKGRLGAIGSRIFVGTNTDVRRVSASAQTQWVATEGRCALVTDNRLYYTFRTTGDNLKLRRVPLEPTSAAPHPHTNVGTIGGIDETVDLAGDGVDVFVLVSEDESKPFLYRYDGTDLTEFWRLDKSFFVQNDLREVMDVSGGFLFIGGYFTDSHGNVDDPALLWISTDGRDGGVVGRIRERGNSEQIKAIYADMDGEVLMGTTKGNVFSFSLPLGGFYQFASGITSGLDITSITYSKGVYYFATRSGGNSKVWATKASGTGKYVASSKVEQSRWDFDRAQTKVLLEVEISGNFPTNTSAELSFETDDGAEITTDAAGATMTTSTTGRTTFTVSSSSVERSFRWLKPNVTLKTSDTSVRPRIYYVDIRATTVQRVPYIEARIDLRDLHGDRALPNRSVTASKMADELAALLNSTTNYVVQVKPFYAKAAGRPRTTETFNAIIDGGDITLDSPGEGEARLLMRIM